MTTQKQLDRWCNTPFCNLISEEKEIRKALANETREDVIYELEDILQEIGLAKAENAAYYNGCYEPEDDGAGLLWDEMMEEREWELQAMENDTTPPVAPQGQSYCDELPF